MTLINSYPPDPGPVWAPGHYAAHDWAAQSLRTLEGGSLDWVKGPTPTYLGGFLEPYPSLYATPTLWRFGQVVVFDGLTRALISTPAGADVLQLDPDWCDFYGDYPPPPGPEGLRVICTGNQGEDKQARFDVGGDGRVRWYGTTLAVGAYAQFTACWGLNP